jgi:hypothetical protein
LKAPDNCNLTLGGTECPLNGLEAAITLPGTDALSMPHNAQISGVAKVARLLRKQKA